MTDDASDTTAVAQPATLLGRLVAGGISEDRARSWITTGGARLDGEPVTDPDAPAPPSLRVVLFPA